MSKKSELIKNTIIIFGGKIATQFSSFLLLPLYTSYLSTSDYGVIDLIITYITLLVPVVTLQEEMATFRFLIDCRDSNEKKQKVIYNSLKVIFLSALFFIFLYGIVCLFVNIPFKIYILVYVLVTMFSGLFLQIARGLGKNVVFSIASFLTSISILIFNIVFIIIFGIGAKGILISTILANIICILVIFFSLKIYRCINKEFNDKEVTKEMIKYSLPLVPNGISWWIVNVSDRIIISTILNIAANGIYAISTKFSSILSALFGIFSMSWTESASIHINDDDRDEFFSDIVDNVIRIFSCICIGIVAFMPYVFNIFIKESFDEAYKYIPINLIASFFNCIVGIYSSIYIAKKLTKKVASTSVLAALINIVINLLFIRFIGLYAACISTVISYLSMTIYRHYDLKKYVNLKYNHKTLILTLIAFIIVYIFYYLNNIYINMINLILVIIYSIVINRKLLVIILKKYALKV